MPDGIWNKEKDFQINCENSLRQRLPISTLNRHIEILSVCFVPPDQHLAVCSSCLGYLTWSRNASFADKSSLISKHLADIIFIVWPIWIFSYIVIICLFLFQSKCIERNKRVFNTILYMRNIIMSLSLLQFINFFL